MKKLIISIAVIFLILSLVGAVVFLVRKWNQPLGTSLGLPTIIPITEKIVSSSQTTPSVTNDSTAQIEEPLSPEQTSLPARPQPVCGGPPIMYILGIGADGGVDYLYGLADVIRIARVDFVTPKVTVLTIPRDLWVEFPNLKEEYAETVSHGKLNQAYLYGGPGMDYYQGSGGGPGLLAHTIAHNYGLYVDNFAAINIYAFEAIIDAIGGIDIYLDQDWDGRPVDDQTEDMGYFQAGQHHMAGNEALRFSRIRKKYSEVTRTDNQTLVICAIQEKITRPGVISSIPNLIDALIGTIQTDLTPAQLRQLTCLLPKLGEDNLQFVRFPDEMMIQGRVYDPHLGKTTFVWDIPEEDIRAFIREFENDLISTDSGGGMQCP
jgi:polyisoprenyl-teichoic acid--peptidoglycan teichoic acid transferase